MTYCQYQDHIYHNDTKLTNTIDIKIYSNRFFCYPCRYDVMLCCWSIFPEQRPNFTDISLRIEGMLDAANEHCRVTCKLEEQTQYIIEMISPALDISTHCKELHKV